MEQSIQNFADVVIVGYGPVGATAANFLGQAGLDVVVVERDPSVFPRARAISTDEDVLRCWQHVGLARELKAEMLGDRPIDFVDAEGRSFMSFAPVSRGNGHPPQMFIYQPAVDATIRRGVERYPNVRVLLEHEAGRVRQTAAGVIAEVTNLGDRSRFELHGRYLLACDGGSSPIRTQLGIGFEGKTYEDPWVVIDTKVKEEWPEVDRLRFHCDPRRPAVDCPTPLGHHRWEFPVLPGEDREEVSAEGAVWKMLGRYGITDRQVEILRRAVYVHHVRFADRWRDRRIFLLGDAAHCMPPWIGQGMASGIRDADNLCWKLAAVLRGEAGEALLDTYEPERQPSVRELTRAAVFFGRVITERRSSVASARDHLFRVLMRTPAVGSHLRDGKWARMPSCGRGGFIDHGARAGLVGERLVPQTEVVDHQGRRGMLDDFLAGRWALLVLPEGADRSAAARRYWEEIGAATFTLVDRTPSRPGELRDESGALPARLRGDGIASVVLRPDLFAYSAALADEPLVGPPLLLARPAAAGAMAPVRAVSPGERLLAGAASRLDDRALELAFGNPVALGAIFNEMARGFVPGVANGFVGEIQYELVRTSGRTARFMVGVEASRARPRRGRAKSPALTVRLRLTDFLRMAAGEFEEVDLLKARRVDLQGDGLLGSRLGPMFGRPAPVDIYVAPPTVDPPNTPVPDLQEARP
ncbi:MAG: bifunctional 3-(3-hydroxy-phenyl)propionate/3-hydroxycinnamic acid hydroxylase [Actinobacteria bacterium]|nr:bifunctional 3-(3-hydroxy-phenyl)propionate/3-hydroxycinnamic acid hydroxylase [Actinomycetota bacterium]